MPGHVRTARRVGTAPRVGRSGGTDSEKKRTKAEKGESETKHATNCGRSKADTDALVTKAFSRYVSFAMTDKGLQAATRSTRKIGTTVFERNAQKATSYREIIGAFDRVVKSPR